MESVLLNLQDWYQTYRPSGTTLERGLWLFWTVWILLILAALLRVIKFRLGLAKELKSLGGSYGLQKPAVVIVPIKGLSPTLTSEFFQSLLDQDYWKYRIIVAVETSDDPAAVWLFNQFGLSLSYPVWAPVKADKGLQSVHLVIAGKSRGQGQKVQNQLAAFETLTPDDAIIAFVDADIVCPKDWLSRLATPINRGDNDLASTYRWLVPMKSRLASQFASVINASVTTQGGNVRENMPWGGSMAISRAAFDHIDVPQLFAGSLNDDLRLGKAAKRLGYRVTYLRSLVRPTLVDFTWGSFLEFARRQYLQVKIFAPILYSCGNLVFIIYLLGWISIVGAIGAGYFWAWGPVIVATILDQIRASTRESIYRALFGNDPKVYKQIAKMEWIEHFLTPVYMVLHGLIVFSTWFMNKVEWGGVKYQVEGVNKTRVLGRRTISNTVDLSSTGSLALSTGGVFTAINAITYTVAQDESSSGVVSIDLTGPSSDVNTSSGVDLVETVTVPETAGEGERDADEVEVEVEVSVPFTENEAEAETESLAATDPFEEAAFSEKDLGSRPTRPEGSVSAVIPMGLDSPAFHRPRWPASGNGSHFPPTRQTGQRTRFPAGYPRRKPSKNARSPRKHPPLTLASRARHSSGA